MFGFSADQNLSQLPALCESHTSQEHLLERPLWVVFFLHYFPELTDCEQYIWEANQYN